MQDVYSNKYVTIAAAAASDSAGGLFAGAATRNKSIAKVRYMSVTGQEAYVHVQKEPDRLQLMSFAPPHATSPQPGTKLSTRAWVLQEYLLSRRTLNFAESELWWGCELSIHCERTIAPQEPKYDNSKKNYTKIFHYEVPPGDASNSHSVLKETDSANWERLIIEFNNRDLTYPTDRLAAIQGLAAKYEQKTGHKYLFGLWQERFGVGLEWSNHERIGSRAPQISRRYDPYLPSWSWASVTGRATYQCTHMISPDHMTISYRKDVLEAHFVQEDEVERGMVKMNGLVVPVKLSALTREEAIQLDSYSYGWMGDPSKSIVSGPETAMYPWNSEIEFNVVSQVSKDGGQTCNSLLNPDVKGDGYEISADDEHLLLVTSIWFSTVCFSIVLRRSRKDPLAYERVGCLRPKTLPKRSDTFLMGLNKGWHEIGIRQTIYLI